MGRGADVSSAREIELSSKSTESGGSSFINCVQSYDPSAGSQQAELNGEVVMPKKVKTTVEFEGRVSEILVDVPDIETPLWDNAAELDIVGHPVPRID